jgi:hypothetical protein
MEGLGNSVGKRTTFMGSVASRGVNVCAPASFSAHTERIRLSPRKVPSNSHPRRAQSPPTFRASGTSHVSR